MEGGRFLLTRDLAGRRVAVTRENCSDTCALPGWFDGLIVETEVQGASEQSSFYRKGLCALFLMPNPAESAFSPSAASGPHALGSKGCSSGGVGMSKGTAKWLQAFATCFFLFFFIVLIHGTTEAATFCVNTAVELQSALTSAASNGEDDVIQIVQGTYEGNFVSASTEAFDLSVEGGYVAGCASRVVDPANTVLDGMASGTVLVLSSDQEVDFAVDGLTLQNGLTSGNGGGFFASTDEGRGGGEVILTNNTLTNNTTSRDGG